MNNNGLITAHFIRLDSRLLARSGLLTLLLLAMYCLSGIPLAFAGSSIENPQHLIRVADKFIHHEYDHKYELTVEFGYLDTRLQLEKCQQELEAFFPPRKHELGATSVGIRCDQPSWQVYIPVEIHAYAEVLTTSRPLAKDTILAAEDISRSKREISRYRSGIFEDAEQLIGMVVKRPMPSGSVFTPREVMPKRLVRRGEPVMILAQSGGMTVRVEGEALMDGHHGQMIRVQNSRSGREITAEVIAASTVRVKM